MLNFFLTGLNKIKKDFPVFLENKILVLSVMMVKGVPWEEPCPARLWPSENQFWDSWPTLLMQLVYHSSQWGDAVSSQIPANKIRPLYTQFRQQSPRERGIHGKGGFRWRLTYKRCTQRCWGNRLLSLWGHHHLSEVVMTRGILQ